MGPSSTTFLGPLALVALQEQCAIARAEQRKVLRVNCDLDLKRVDRLNAWIEHCRRDKRRSW